MGVRRGRVLVAALASLVWLSGCETSTKLGDLLQSKTSDDPSTTAALPGAADEPVTTGSLDQSPGEARQPPPVSSAATSTTT